VAVDITRGSALAAMQEAAVEVLGDEAPELVEGMSLADSGMDSLDVIEVLMVVEERYGIVIDASDVEGVETLGDVIDVIVRMASATVRS
jgi:acyl carrier protein